MCTALEEMIREGEQRGEARGEIRGEIRGEARGRKDGMKELINKMKENGLPEEQIAHFLGWPLNELTQFLA